MSKKSQNRSQAYESNNVAALAVPHRSLAVSDEHAESGRAEGQEGWAWMPDMACPSLVSIWSRDPTGHTGQARSLGRVSRAIAGVPGFADSDGMEVGSSSSFFMHKEKVGHFIIVLFFKEKKKERKFFCQPWTNISAQPSTLSGTGTGF